MRWSQLIEKRKKTNRNPKLIEFEDKVRSKEIAKKLGCPTPETYYVTTTPESIPFTKLPKRYVVKATHLAGSQSVFLIDNNTNIFTRKPVSYKEIITVQKKALTQRLSRKKNEWATQKIKPQIIVEELLGDGERVATDYKCYTFHGVVCLVKMDRNRNLKNAYTDYFTRDCSLISWDWICLRDKRKFKPITKPAEWDQMIHYAELLGKHFSQEEKCGDFVRIDFYLTNKGPYFGEFTVYPGSGAKSGFKPWVDKWMGYLWVHGKKNPKILYKKLDKKTKNRFS